MRPRLGPSISHCVNFAAVAFVAEPLRPFDGRCVARPADVSGGAAWCLLLRRCGYRSAVVSVAAPLCLSLRRWVDFCAVACNGAAWWWSARVRRAKSSHRQSHDHLQHERGVEACDQVIEQDAPAVRLGLEAVGGPGFGDVEDAEEQERAGEREAGVEP